MFTAKRLACAVVILLLMAGTAYVTSQICSRQIVYVTQAIPPESEAWALRSDHLLHGMPQVTDLRYNFQPPDSDKVVPGISVLIHEGAAIGHCDKYKIPLWVSMKWTERDLKATKGKKSPERHFLPDLELPPYARGTPDYKGDAQYDRGHMARNLDNLAWGEDNADKGDLMSNIVPQTQHLNQHVWLALEEAHRNAVGRKGMSALWVISGSLLRDGKPESFLRNGVGVPYATYKIIAWHDHKHVFHARGFICPQDAKSTDPSTYLVSIKEIESKTGLNFFPKLEEPTQSIEESKKHSKLWEEE